MSSQHQLASALVSSSVIAGDLSAAGWTPNLYASMRWKYLQLCMRTRGNYPCSKDGLIRLTQAIREQDLDQVVVAGCTPRLVEKLFRQAAQNAGLDASRLEVVNVREHCAWVHPAQSPAALQKACEIVEMGVQRLSASNCPPVYSARTVQSALIVGSGLGGLAAALTLARAGLPVLLVEDGSDIGPTLLQAGDQTKETLQRYRQALASQPMIRILVKTHIRDLAGSPGDYQVTLEQNGEIIYASAGAILLASEALPQPLSPRRWVNRQRVKTQSEFELLLSQGNVPSPLVMVLEEAEESGSAHLCSLTALRQAITARQINPQAEVLVLFRDLDVASNRNQNRQELLRARQLGVQFFRYPKRAAPEIRERIISITDNLTGQPLEIPYEMAVLATPWAVQDSTRTLAALLGLPQDEHGFIMEHRPRLRPGRFPEDGLYVVGGSHQPADSDGVAYQAVLAATRAEHFLKQEHLQVQAATAQVDVSLCTGCAECVQVCMSQAVHLERRAGLLSLSKVDPLRCTGCGSCAVACPVKAIQIPGWEDAAILAQISAALRTVNQPQVPGMLTPAHPRILVMACEWSAYAAADLAGKSQQTYPVDTRILRINCSARFDPMHILWAFLIGASGVLLGVCPPGECHYGRGNHYANQRYQMLQTRLVEHGFDPHRLRLEFLSTEDGAGFVKAIQSFNDTITNLASSHPGIRMRA